MLNNIIHSIIVVELIIVTWQLWHISKSIDTFIDSISIDAGVEYMDTPIHSDSDKDTLVPPTEFMERQIRSNEEEAGIEIMEDKRSEE